jgi:hypothetical protein
VKPTKRTVTLPTLFGEREVEAEVWADWVLVHKSWARGDRSPWVVAVLPSGGYIARLRLKGEAKALAGDVAQTFSNAEGIGDNIEGMEAVLNRHGLTMLAGPIGKARKCLGYERCHIGHREVWE